MIETTEYYVEGVFLLIIGTFGIIGNVSAIVVFTRQNLQKSFYGLMLSLAAFDLLYIITSILCYGIPPLSDEYEESKMYNSNFYWIRALSKIAMTGSIYFTMAITVERYVTVCHPFYRVSHSWPTKRFVLFLVVFAILYNIPTFFELEPKEFNDLLEDGGGWRTYIQKDYPTKMRANQYYYQIYVMWLSLLLMSIGPFVLLVVLNALIVQELIKLSRGNNILAGPGSPSNRGKDIVLAKVSLAIVFVFILCHSVKWIPNVYELMYPLWVPDNHVWPNWIKIITHFSHLALVFNSSVNFYIYLGKHWRTIFNIPESSASNETEMTRLPTSVVTHKMSQISQKQNPDCRDQSVNQKLLSGSNES